MSFEAELGAYQPVTDETQKRLHDQEIVKRLWDHDHTIWRPDPDEITNRLDWLTIADEIDTDALSSFTDDVRKAGFTDVLLMGMGGSSLAPEVFSRIFGSADGHPTLQVLDSTDPDAVLAMADKLDLTKTLFIVASKSGGTAETLSFFKFFYNKVLDAVGEDTVGDRFVAITDPGSKLVALGEKLGFRKVFENNPNIGGRYSALSYFGLAPAALIGVDIERLLTVAKEAMAANRPGGDGYAVDLGVIMSKLAAEGRDKLTFVTSAQLESFGDWVEQLIAESTGKEGKGILPVVSEPLGSPSVYGDDRLFVHLALDNDGTHDSALASLVDEGHPLITVNVDDIYELGAQYFIWEFATAVAGWVLDIQPFDQPNVEAAKILARDMIKRYEEEGELPDGELAPLEADALQRFLDSTQEGDYITLQAFIQPTDETTGALAALRLAVRDHYKVATTAAYGPRYLHSTGQLHKGDDGHGLFVQFISDPNQDVNIPEEAGEERSIISFGVLKDAQALGDAQALRNEGRRIIRFNLGKDVLSGLTTLTEPFV